MLDTPAPLQRAIRVCLLDDHPVVEAGLAALLERDADRVEVVRAAGLRVPRDADVILADSAARRTRSGLTTRDLLRPVDASGRGTRVAVLTWRMEEGLVEEALADGAHGYLFKGLPGQRLVELLLRLHEAEVVVPDFARPVAPRRGPSHPALTDREQDVLALLARGRTNPEIAADLYLSVNSVKTYVRTAYRKIGATRRTEAVTWALAHGLDERAPGRRAAAPAPPVDRTTPRHRYAWSDVARYAVPRVDTPPTITA